MVPARSSLRAALVALAVAAIAVLGSVPAGAAAATPRTVYRGAVPDLRVELVFRGPTLTFFAAWGTIGCGNRPPIHGFIESDTLTARVHPDGRFRFLESESQEDVGRWYTRLVGTVEPNRIEGSFRTWEEAVPHDEEGPWPPRCGTVVPRGRTIPFVARRVVGPPLPL